MNAMCPANYIFVVIVCTILSESFESVLHTLPLSSLLSKQNICIAMIYQVLR